MRHRGAKLGFVALLCTLALGCATTGVDSGEEVASPLARDLAPEVSSADAAALVADNTAFACDLFRQVRHDAANVFVSPYSVSLALAMTYAGAESETAAEMAEALRFGLPEERLHPAMNALDLRLAQLGDGKTAPRLSIANAIWGRRGYTFLEPFLDTLAVNYGAGLRTLDFANAPEPSRRTINTWVSDRTEGTIKDLLPPNSVTPATAIVLTNAVYFLAPWETPFAPEATTDGPFRLTDGSTVSAKLMHQGLTQLYGEGAIGGASYQAVELPYKGGELAMLAILPEAGGIDALEENLTAEALAAATDSLSERTVYLTLPTFGFDASFSLNEALESMGMVDAFDPSASDFSGMAGSRDIVITHVVHKTHVAVDEEGTEASAGTGVIGDLTGYPEDPVTVTLDRPFLFLIRDRETGIVLFLGRLGDPRE